MTEDVIRIAHIMGKMNSGGVESFVMNYYRNIDRTKVQFDFIIDSDSTIVPKEEIEMLGGKIIEIPPYQKIFSYIKELKKILNENEYKIVHSHLNSLSVFPLFAAYLAKVPVRIAHSHSTTNKKEWKKNIIKNFLKPFSKVFATHYFACSEHAAKWLFGNKTLKNGDVKIIHNAIDLNKFQFNKDVRDKIRKSLNIDNKFVLGHVGRFVEQKNQAFLIDVFYEVYKENENAVLLLIGEGPLEEEIKEKINDMKLQNAVYFLGVRNDVNELMQAMDVFVFPSLYEGLGIVAIEAQISGLNVISSEFVPEEAAITCNMKFLNLEKGKWKDYIFKCIDQKKDRTKVVVENKKYEIKDAVKILENEYLNYI